MQSDDDLQTTLSKWPFILGDVLLVSTALAIAILGQGQLSNWQVASCAISVALGAGLFVLPYIVEFQVRVREEAEDRNADLRILQRHLVSKQDQLEAVSDRIESLEAGLANLAQAKPDSVDLITSLAALEGKIDPLNSEQAAQSSQLEALAQQIVAMVKVIDSKPTPETIEALQTELSTLQTKVEELPAQVVEAPIMRIINEDAQPLAAAEPKAKKIPEPRMRRAREPRLLQRAIEQKQDKSSQAVSRIINSEPKQAKVAKEEAPDEPAPAEAPVTPTSEVEAPKAEPGTPAPEPVAETSQESKEVEPREEPTEPELAPKPELEPKPELQETTPPEPEAPAEPVAEEYQAEPQEPVGSDDMFGDAVPAQVSKRTRTKKNDTVAIASVFIGIGNKPFVRGSGAGLSWDSGIAMEFEEIGKWCWIAPADLEEPVEIQLFRNDEDPDTTGKYTLEPGQKFELSPVF